MTARNKRSVVTQVRSLINRGTFYVTGIKRKDGFFTVYGYRNGHFVSGSDPE